MTRQLVDSLLSYLFLGVAILAFALTMQVVFEWTTAQLRWTTVGAFAGAASLAATLHYLQRLCRTWNGRIRGTRSFKMTAITASLFAGVVLAFTAHLHMQPESVVTTGAGQLHHMTLPDGTAVHVDARSKVEIAYTAAERIVHVHQGSAVFDVAKDPNRPFIARTRLVDAVAVSTRFGVSIDRGVTTTVCEGVVKVTRRGQADSAAVMLKAGYELHAPDGALTSPHIAHVDAERKLQWSSGWLTLGGRTVAEGVEQFNRRNRTQIVLDSPELGKRVVEFVRVQVDSPESYARAVVAEEPDITMTIDNERGVIRLSE